MRTRKESEKEAFERLPVHLQQVVLIVGAIVKRIEEKKKQKGCLLFQEDGEYQSGIGCTELVIQ